MTAPLPGPDGPGVSLAGGSSLVIFRGTAHADAAWKLVEYLSAPETQARFFELTLQRLEPQLRAAGYVGYINLNTIVNEAGIWPLEFTCRFGYPGFAILDALQPDGWAALFAGMRDRCNRFETTPGFAVGVVLTVPPFPYRYGYREISCGLPILIDPELGAAARDGLHFGEVAVVDGQLVTSGVCGYLMVATGTGATVRDAQRSAYALAARVHVPNLRYRNDIGDAFAREGLAALQRLGYMP